VGRAAEGDRIPLEAVLDSIYRRRRWIEGVVVKGGEPLAHRETKDLLELLKDFGLATRVDTNGTRPRTLDRLIDDELLDYVALELKGALDETYHRIAGPDADLGSIYESIEVLLSGKVDHEFRLAVYREHHGREEVLKLARTIRGARRLVLRSVPGRGPSRAGLRSLARLAAPYVESCHLDGHARDGDLLPREGDPREAAAERKGA
jgi:pyruvate formate lyase activating enzyme